MLMDSHGIKLESSVMGTVKWFDVSKGFGFIVSDSGGPDILLHANVLRNFGQGSVSENSRIEVIVQETARGVQAQAVFAIDPPAYGEGDFEMDMEGCSEPTGPHLAARVKWFDKAKGFGFANVFGHPEDVFVHVEVLRRFGLADLQAGEAICIRISEGPRGQMAAEIRSWDFVEEV
jgi:CspA family cold shock protein